MNKNTTKFTTTSNQKSSSKQKVMLIIRDGYGRRDERDDNAVVLGKTPYTDMLMEKYPTCLLRTSGEDVGLPKDTMGGSEVGHLTIGSGRIVWQKLELINRTIKDSSFFENKAFVDEITYAKEHGKAIHLIGLLQDKGVHAHQEHLFALIRLCAIHEIEKDKVIVHIFSDGRDSPPKSVLQYINKLESVMNSCGVGVIGSIIGRFYAMDRDTRWDRTKLAYELLTQGAGTHFNTIQEAIDFNYSLGKNDEFIEACKIGDFCGIYNGDIVINYNYRTDRVRQLTKALLESDFDSNETFHRELVLNIRYVAMSKYYESMPAKIAFGTQIPKNTLGEVISKNKLTQLRISETEKYPHVTFFFNGQYDEEFKGESRVLIPSPRDVKTYDEKPEMSIYEIKDNLLKEMEKEYDLIVVNYVNGDMVGHTGKLSAAIKAVEAVDNCVKETVNKALELGYDTLIFADHGNCEEMAGEHQTSHTLNDVDCILVSSKEEFQKENIVLKYGGLCDIAPTALYLLGVEQPKEMEGEVLIRKKKQLTHEVANIFKRR
ncbi:MAG: 2,3-bisphosphoglycerate-independent phosphoglycerate mutase [Nanoarchaeota archaeon]|nr:2,3-bisphosphoglycerate-independent phosphoglycerate mutase [Nanoarchaeota archaeon]